MKLLRGVPSGDSSVSNLCASQKNDEIGELESNLKASEFWRIKSLKVCCRVSPPTFEFENGGKFGVSRFEREGSWKEGREDAGASRFDIRSPRLKD